MEHMYKGDRFNTIILVHVNKLEIDWTASTYLNHWPDLSVGTLVGKVVVLGGDGLGVLVGSRSVSNIEPDPLSVELDLVSVGIIVYTNEVQHTGKSSNSSIANSDNYCMNLRI